MNPRCLFIAISLAVTPASAPVVAVAHDSDGEYFGVRDPQTQAMADRLHANAHVSSKRFEDISMLGTWFIGSCRSGNHVLHFRAYFDLGVAHIGVFGADEQLRVFWKFHCDARQFYTEGSKLMFVAHPRTHGETSEAFAKVPRQVLFDLASPPKEGFFFFDGNTYEIPKDTWAQL